MWAGHADRVPDVPARLPGRVIDPFMNQTGRGVIGNRPASGTEIIQELGEEHQQTGKWIVYTSADSVFQIAAHEETIPLEELYDGCRVAREILTGRHAVGRVIARPFVGEPGNYERTPNRHDFSLEPPARTTSRRCATRGARCTASGRSSTSSPVRRRRLVPDEVEVDGINRTVELLENIDEGLVFVNLVETDMLWGHRNDPVNFHRCLQDFDRRLPDILETLSRATCSSSRRITAATRRPHRPTTRGSTRSSWRTRRDRTRPGGFTRRASSPTSVPP